MSDYVEKNVLRVKIGEMSAMDAYALLKNHIDIVDIEYVREMNKETNQYEDTKEVEHFDGNKNGWFVRRDEDVWYMDKTLDYKYGIEELPPTSMNAEELIAAGEQFIKDTGIQIDTHTQIKCLHYIHFDATDEPTYF